jgi:hypothetical protein
LTSASLTYSLLKHSMRLSVKFSYVTKGNSSLRNVIARSFLPVISANKED